MGIWFCPLNQPKAGPDGHFDWSKQRMHLSDGPLKPEYIGEYLAGRIIGILKGTEAADRRCGPIHIDLSHLSEIKAADEIKWRYLEWLNIERRVLAEELGAEDRKTGMIFTFCDRSVTRFFSQKKEAAGDRAGRVLKAAGVTTRRDPDWNGYALGAKK